MPQMTIPENTLTPQERNKLVEDNINLVKYYVNKICKDYNAYEDCFQEGCLGLMRAARLYDPSREAKFNTFASFEIQCSIRDYLWKNQSIKLPDEQRSAINKYKTRIRQMEVAGEDITSEEADSIAKECGMVKSVHNIVDNPTVSLQSTYSNDEESSDLESTIADSKVDVGQSNLELDELVDFITEYFNNIQVRDSETKEILIEELQSLIDGSLGTAKSKAFIDIIRRRHPEYATTKAEESTASGKLKLKELDKIYCKTNYAWNKHKKALAEALRANDFATI